MVVIGIKFIQEFTKHVQIRLLQSQAKCLIPIITDSVSVNVSAKERIIDIITQMPTITVKELAKMLSIAERTIYRQIEILKTENKVERVGSDKTESND